MALVRTENDVPVRPKNGNVLFAMLAVAEFFIFIFCFLFLVFVNVISCPLDVFVACNGSAGFLIARIGNYCGLGQGVFARNHRILRKTGPG